MLFQAFPRRNRWRTTRRRFFLTYSLANLLSATRPPSGFFSR
nr:MAG TPA: hypothetical protein [Caudoviricetes sp.]